MVATHSLLSKTTDIKIKQRIQISYSHLDLSNGYKSIPTHTKVRQRFNSNKTCLLSGHIYATVLSFMFSLLGYVISCN